MRKWPTRRCISWEKLESVCKSHKLPHAHGCVHCWYKQIQLQGGQRYCISSSSKFGSLRPVMWTVHSWKENLDNSNWKMPCIHLCSIRFFCHLNLMKNITCLEGKNIMPGSTLCTPMKTNSGNGLSNWYCGIIKSHFPAIHLSEVQWSWLCLFAIMSIMWSYDLLTSGSSKA